MQTTIQYIEKELNPFYPKTEVEGFTRLIIESVSGWNFTEQIINKSKVIESEKLVVVKSIVSRLKKYEPIQYILGETEFFGLKIKVAPAVLIPRPETEELVAFILEKVTDKKCTILDIGTGSGCIALALKHSLKVADVYGTDISEKALETAKFNANANKLNVAFFISDILYWKEKNWQNFDVIVSNPPYIRESEKEQMKANVLDYEPPEALFVSDSDALVFYRKIAQFAKKHLNKNGFLFFEINENLGTQTVELLEKSGFTKIELRNDINGKKRMICSRK